MFANFEKLIRFHWQAFVVYENGENTKMLIEIFCQKLIASNVILSFLDLLKPLYISSSPLFKISGSALVVWVYSYTLKVYLIKSFEIAANFIPIINSKFLITVFWILGYILNNHQRARLNWLNLQNDCHGGQQMLLRSYQKRKYRKQKLLHLDL